MREYFSNIYTGILSFWGGMSLTLKHLRNKSDLVATLQYPHEKWPIPERNIGYNHSEYNVIRTKLHVDIDDCIGCLMCEKACPVDCIKIDTIKPPKGSEYDCGTTTFGTHKKMIVPRFTIDMSECMYCNLCVYPCPEECIYMVGGPNQEKQDIDYEYSKYERNGLIFEFSDSTEQDIIDIGGHDYLEKRKEKNKRIKDGRVLLGSVPIIDEDTQSSDTRVGENKDSGKTELLNIKSFNLISDKMIRGTAKKIFLSETKSGISPKDALNKVIEELSKKGTIDPDINLILESLKNIKDIPIESTEGVSITVKSFNSLANKMQRGLAKKIFIQETKKGTSVDEILKIIRSEAVESSTISDDLVNLLDSLAKDAVPQSFSSPEIHQTSLFDIKLLNVIEDKMCRGIAKKTYVKGKKENLSSVEILDNIISELEKNNKSPSDFDAVFNSIREGL